MKKVTELLAVFIFIGWSVNANATIINQTLTLTGTDWLLDPSNIPATPSVDPVVLNFSITFDNAVDITNGALGLTINSFNLPIASLVYGYRASDDILHLSAIGAWPGSCTTYPFCSVVRDISSTSPTSSFMSMELSGVQYKTFTVTAEIGDGQVPIPATLTLFTIGLAGLGWSSSRKKS